MPSYRDLCRYGETYLSECGITESSLDARLLLEFVMNTDRNYLYAHGDASVEDSLAAEYTELLQKRAAHMPLQYLTGYQDFMGLRFLVNEHVLIPRQDTECLVEEAMLEIMDGMRVLDMCTGSGCILISLMKYKNELDGTAVDISNEALCVARKNAELHQVGARFLQGDLFHALEENEQKFDVIVSNPPYICTDVIDTLMEEVREHEPLMALDGTMDGLFFYQEITARAKDYLVRGGKLLFEIGYDQGASVKALLLENGFKDIRVVQDLAGLDRVVCGTLRA